MENQRLKWASENVLTSAGYCQFISFNELKQVTYPSPWSEKQALTSFIRMDLVTGRMKYLTLVCNFLVWVKPIFYTNFCLSFQRHFTVFAFNFPSLDALNTIYGQIFSFHFQHQAFAPSLLRSGTSLIQATIAFHHMMTQNFLPTAIKFHYIFNLRDLSNIFQVAWLLYFMFLSRGVQ